MSILLRAKKLIAIFVSIILFTNIFIAQANFEDLDVLNYQISNDSETWWYTEDNKWFIAVNDSQSSSLNEIKKNISVFSSNQEQLFLKAFESAKNNQNQQNSQDQAIIKNEKPILNITSQPTPLIDGSGSVMFQLKISDANKDTTAIKVAYSIDDKTWSNAEIKLAICDTGDIAIDKETTNFQIGKNLSIPTSLGEVNLFIIWDSQEDLSNYEGNVRLKFIPFDGLSYGEEIEAGIFQIDNKAPEGLTNLFINSIGTDIVHLTWDKIQNTAEVDKYEIFYGENKLLVQNQDSSKIKILQKSTNSISVQGLKANTLYYFAVSAKDFSANTKLSPIVSAITFPLKITNEEDNNQSDDKNNASEPNNEIINESKINENNNSETNDQVIADSNIYEAYEQSLNLQINKCAQTDFKDLKEDHWAKKFIDVLHNFCINGNPVIQGYSDGTFKPDQNISRFELLKLLLTIKQIDLKSAITTEKVFLDVVKNNNDMIAQVVYKAYEVKIADGYSDEKFYPDKLVNRAEAAKLINKALNLNEQESNFKNFTDSLWYLPYIYEVSKNDIMSGYENGNFGLENPLLRSETAKIIYVIMEREGMIKE